jgi:hypothetical protein
MIDAADSPGAPGALDSRRYELFVNVLPRCPAFAAMLVQRVRSAAFEGRIGVARKSAGELLQIAAEPLDEAPDAILEEVVCGPTSAVLQFTTAAAIVAELASLEEECMRTSCHH